MTCHTCDRYDLIGFAAACPCTHIDGKCTTPTTRPIMNGQPAERTQTDGLQDDYSSESAIDTGTDTPTRQEFKDEADLNILLSRFGANPNTRVMEYGGEIDYNLDLQQALAAVTAARNAQLNVPPELQSKYPTWTAVLEGAENGQYQADLQILADKKAAETQPAPPIAAP